MHAEMSWIQNAFQKELVGSSHKEVQGYTGESFENLPEEDQEASW